MGEATRMVTAIAGGGTQTAGELLPVVYHELRQLAARELAQEYPGQTLQATALVHEAWLRLSRHKEREFLDSKHFFFVAAQAMRRILLENARRKKRVKHGGLLQRVQVEPGDIAAPMPTDTLLALDEALQRFALEEPQAAQLVELRFFAGLGHQEAAQLMGIPRSAADGLWAYARAWLYEALKREGLTGGRSGP